MLLGLFALLLSINSHGFFVEVFCPATSEEGHARSCTGGSRPESHALLKGCSHTSVLGTQRYTRHRQPTIMLCVLRLRIMRRSPQLPRGASLIRTRCYLMRETSKVSTSSQSPITTCILDACDSDQRSLKGNRAVLNQAFPCPLRLPVAAFVTPSAIRLCIIGS